MSEPTAREYVRAAACLILPPHHPGSHDARGSLWHAELAIKRNRGIFVEILRRYMQLRYALELIETEHLTLISPRRWSDTNDADGINLYCEKNGIRSVWAACFTLDQERHHLWNEGATTINLDESKVCVEFDADGLLATLSRGGRRRSLWHGSVKYRAFRELRGTPPEIDELPFLKRRAYAHESEYRIISFSKREVGADFTCVRIDVSAIVGVVVSPNLEREQQNTAVEMLENRIEDDYVHIRRSQLHGSKAWLRLLKRTIGQCRSS